VAAASIAFAAYGRLLDPKPLEQIGAGLIVSAAASAINLATALLLVRVGRKRNSITLEANGHHLMTDVWTSVGVIAAVGAVAMTGWTRLDSIVAFVVAANIVWTGVKIVRRSVAGLMDASLPASDLEQVQKVFARHEAAGIKFHALRTRQAGTRKFVSVDVLVPGAWPVQQGHDLVEKIEAEIRAVVAESSVFTHLEPIEDPLSWADEKLDRPADGSTDK
jgi:cation diffusion facilitator family transporter